MARSKKVPTENPVSSVPESSPEVSTDNSPIDTVAAKTAINQDKEKRAKELVEILQFHSKRLNCQVISVVEIVGDKVRSSLTVIANDL